MIRAMRFASLIAAVLFVGCDNEIRYETIGTGSGGGGQGGSAGQGGAGGSGGAGGQGGQGGEGGGTVSEHGPAAKDMVGAGKVTTSTNFRLVWTMGQSTQNQSKMSTTKYRLQGGLVGANGSVP